MKIIKTKKYEKIAQHSENSLKNQVWEAVVQRFMKIKPLLEKNKKEYVNPDEDYFYKGRADDANYIARKFLESYFRNYNENGEIPFDTIEKIKNGLYDNAIEEAWHDAANAEWYYSPRGGKEF